MSEPMSDETAALIHKLENRTSRSVERWVGLVHCMGEHRDSDIVGRLKSAHGLAGELAEMVARLARERGTGETAAGTGMVAAQYAGERAGLKPLYDFVTHTISGLGDDVTIVPQPLWVSARRGNEFAVVQPVSDSRIDLGIAIPGTEPTERLQLIAAPGSAVTHRVCLEHLSDVNKELIGWLKAAYAAN